MTYELRKVPLTEGDTGVSAADGWTFASANSTSAWFVRCVPAVVPGLVAAFDVEAQAWTYRQPS